MAKEIDYETLYDRPYNNDLNRSPIIEENGNVENMPVKSEGALGDVWINNFIKSTNYSPKKTGFYIDGQTGYAEFSNAYIVGTIVASIGEIGGFVIGPDYIRDVANSFGLSSQITPGDDVRFWAGASFENINNAPFQVKESGEGRFGGFIFENEDVIGHDDRMYSIKDPGNSLIEINATNQFIRVGREDDTNINIDGTPGITRIFVNGLGGDFVGSIGAGSGVGAFLDIELENAMRIGEKSDPLIDRFIKTNSIWPSFDGVNYLGLDTEAWLSVSAYRFRAKHNGLTYRQPLILNGYVSSAGTLSTPTVSQSSWTVTKLGTGKYRINHNMGLSNYYVSATPYFGHFRFMIEDQLANSFIVSWQETNYVTQSFSVSGGAGGSVSVSGVRSSGTPEVGVDVNFDFVMFVHDDPVIV